MDLQELYLKLSNKYAISQLVVNATPRHIRVTKHPNPLALVSFIVLGLKRQVKV